MIIPIKKIILESMLPPGAGAAIARGDLTVNDFHNQADLKKDQHEMIMNSAKKGIHNPDPFGLDRHRKMIAINT